MSEKFTYDLSNEWSQIIVEYEASLDDEQHKSDKTKIIGEIIDLEIELAYWSAGLQNINDDKYQLADEQKKRLTDLLARIASYAEQSASHTSARRLLALLVLVADVTEFFERYTAD